MLRLLVTSAPHVTRQVGICSGYLNAAPRILTSSFNRRAFSTSFTTKIFNRGNKPGEFSEEQAARVKQFAETLKNNPELSQLLDGFQTLLVNKGIQTAGKPPSLTQMMKMLTDKDIRDHLTKLKDCLEKSNIQINQQDLNALTDYYLSQKKKEIQ
ncbi:uncharacterized protein RJT20DRAFT_126656 [Scheffersomyces xylosifermentans]|uniref:uncharacterized protein n=1 Tax=Scheffersomyces xylosifermentans TaxID=1304137 RepID=UPI00315CCAB2